MLKKSASGVLAALRGSTYRSVRLASSLAAALLGARRVSARQGWAGEKSGLFEHLAWCTPAIPDLQTSEIPAYQQNFSAACYTLSQGAEKAALLTRHHVHRAKNGAPSAQTPASNKRGLGFIELPTAMQSATETSNRTGGEYRTYVSTASTPSDDFQ